MVLKIAIIGGGVNGVSCAVRIAEYYGSSANVTIISEEYTPNTTGDGSAGLWGPYLCGSTSPEKIKQWSKETHEFLRDIFTSVDGAEAEVCLIPVVRVTTSPDGIETFWKDIVFGCRELSKAELRKLCDEHGKSYTAGLQFITFTSEPIKLLPYLMRRFERSGGITIQKRVNDLKNFVQNSKYDVIVNCTGLGSKDIVPDSNMKAIRGQVSRVKADWMYYVYLDESDDGNYIIPNCESVILGGTHQVNDFNVNPYESDRNFILSGCKQIVPGLSSASEIKDWVGLRPGRNSVRLEKEICGNGKILIHNYGHGGSGVTLAWGCAQDVLSLLKDSKSKL